MAELPARVRRNHHRRSPGGQSINHPPTMPTAYLCLSLILHHCPPEISHPAAALLFTSSPLLPLFFSLSALFTHHATFPFLPFFRCRHLHSPMLLPSFLSHTLFLFLFLLLQGAYASQLFADFIVNKILSLKLLHNIRDENNFSFSSRYAEFVGQVLKAVTELNGKYSTA